MPDENSKGLRSILKDMVLSKTSLVYLVTDEDRRVELEIRGLAGAFKPPLRVYVWSCTTGVTHDDEAVVANPSLINALDWFMGIKETAFLMLNDVHVFLPDNPPVLRKLKDAVKRIENGYKTIFLVSPVLEIPTEISNEVVLVDVPLPTAEEIDRLLDALVAKERHAESLRVSLTEDVRDQFIKGGLGLTSQQALQAFRKSLLGKSTVTPKDIDILFEEKRQIVKKSGLWSFSVKVRGGTIWEGSPISRDGSSYARTSSPNGPENTA